MCRKTVLFLGGMVTGVAGTLLAAALLPDPAMKIVLIDLDESPDGHR